MFKEKTFFCIKVIYIMLLQVLKLRISDTTKIITAMDYLKQIYTECMYSKVIALIIRSTKGKFCFSAKISFVEKNQITLDALCFLCALAICEILYFLLASGGSVQGIGKEIIKLQDY